MKGKAEYPANHHPGMRVDRGGSMCKNCRFLKDPENRICGNEYFVAWNGSEVIPGQIDAYCSDWWEPKQGGSRMAEAMKNG